LSNEETNSQQQKKANELASINEAIREAEALEKSINDTMAERNAMMSEYTKNLASALDAEKAIGKQILAHARNVEESAADRKKAMADLIGMTASYDATLQSIVDKKKEGTALTAEEAEKLSDFTDSMKGLQGYAKKYRDEIAAAVMSFDPKDPKSVANLSKSIAKAEMATKGLKDAQDQVSKISGQVASNFGLTADIGNTVVGQSIEVVNALSKAYDVSGKQGLGGALGSMVMEMFSIERIMASVVQEAIKLAGELDKAGKAFGAATGFDIGGAQAQIKDVSKELVRSGVTMSDVGTSIGELSKNFAGFDPSQINGEMVTTSTLLAKIGVSAGQSAKTFDILITAMGLSSSSAIKMTKNIAAMGKEIGVSATAMISNFNGAAKKLIEFGPQMESVFKNLAIQAKITGMSMDKLIGISEKFDTFEGASNQIADMNSVLGTQMSAMDMMNMTHDQRIQRIRDEVKASVGNFSTLDRFQKKYIAQAMGLSSVEEAQRMLNMTNEKTTDKQKKMAETQDRLKEITEELVPMYDRLKLAFAELVRALDPYMVLFMDLINGLAAFAASGAMEWFIGAIALAAIGMTIWGASAGLAGAQMKLVQLGFMLMLAAIAMFNKSGPLGLTMAAVSVGLLAIAFMALKSSSAEATTSMTILKMLFGSKINPLFIQSFAFMAVGVFLLAIAFKMMGMQGMVAAVALGLVFAGMALVIYSLSFLVESIAQLMGSLVGSVDILPLVAGGILGIAYSVGVLGMAVLMSTGAIMFLLATIGVIGGIFAGIGMFMGISALDGIGKSMDNIGNGMDKFANGLSRVKETAMGMKGMTDNAFMAFSTDGSKTSAIISSTDIVKNMVLGKMTVDVKIPDIEVPQVTVNIYMDGSLISNSLYETILDN
jgi:peptidoglycan hydrolase CwlO-like protein